MSHLQNNASNERTDEGRESPAAADTIADPDADEALMVDYANGDMGAFGRLFERHRRLVFTYLFHQTGDRGVAEDLTQEVFLRVIRGRRKYVASGGFRAWLYTIARHTAADQRRRDQPRSIVNMATSMIEEHGLAATPDHRDSPVVASERSQLRSRIRDALLKIPEAQREVFLLRERAGLNFQSIARITGCGVATAKSRMRYALVGLRSLLGDPSTSIPEASDE